MNYYNSMAGVLVAVSIMAVFTAIFVLGYNAGTPNCHEDEAAFWAAGTYTNTQCIPLDNLEN